MLEYWQIASEKATQVPGEVWAWFGTLNREEWLVTLAIVCACGFLSLMGFRTQRL